MKKLLPLLFVLVVFSCKKSSNNSPNGLPDSYSNQTTGASAKDLLSASKYSSITIQIQYMPGYQLDAATITNLSGFLNTLCNKPGGITINQQQIGASGSDTLSLDKVAALEKQNRTAYTSGSNISLYVMVTDGGYTTANVLGVAYLNTSTCLFGKTLFNNSGGVGQVNRVTLESTVLEHEMGHILGLVDLGTPMVTNHKDNANGNHCNNKNCLMYYATETMDGLGFLMASPVTPLDANCHNDLHANGGK